MILTFTLSSRKQSGVLFKSVTSHMTGSREKLILFDGISFRSKTSIILSYVSWNLYALSSRSMYFAFFIFSSISFLKVSRLDKEYLSLNFPFFVTCSTCNSISFSDLISKNLFCSSIAFLVDLEFQ